MSTRYLLSSDQQLSMTQSILDSGRMDNVLVNAKQSQAVFCDASTGKV